MMKRAQIPLAISTKTNKMGSTAMQPFEALVMRVEKPNKACSTRGSNTKLKLDIFLADAFAAGLAVVVPRAAPAGVQSPSSPLQVSPEVKRVAPTEDEVAEEGTPFPLAVAELLVEHIGEEMLLWRITTQSAVA